MLHIEPCVIYFKRERHGTERGGRGSWEKRAGPKAKGANERASGPPYTSNNISGLGVSQRNQETTGDEGVEEAIGYEFDEVSNTSFWPYIGRK